MSEQQPDWWHREHPVFTRLSAFFTGMATATLVPALFAILTRATLDYRTAQEVFPWVGLVVLIPVALLLPRRTRRFGQYMLFGLVVTAVVVVGVASLVFYLMALRGV